MVGFKVGDKVEHVLSKDWLLVLDVYELTVKCRNKNLETVILNKWEVKVVS